VGGAHASSRAAGHPDAPDQEARAFDCLSLSGALASNGKTARLAHQIWQEHVNTKGKLLGQPVELVCLDDQANPNLVADLYQRLLDVEKVDVVVGGYGDNSVAPAMPRIMEPKRFLGLMALSVNAKFNYPQYFVMIPTGPHPHLALTEGFFQIAGQQRPRPETVAILVADAPFSQSPAQGAKDHLARQGMRVVFEGTYPLSTTDFTPYMEDLKRINPEVLFLCSYIDDSIGVVKDEHRRTLAQACGRSDDRPAERRSESRTRRASQRSRELRVLAPCPEPYEPADQLHW
jgi:branched-chain amino acid transport system substrate-binding protein